MKTKKDIVKDWITRYSGRKINSFGKFILLTNFQRYVDEFAKINNVNVDGLDKNMPSATYEEITIIKMKGNIKYPHPVNFLHGVLIRCAHKLK